MPCEAEVSGKPCGKATAEGCIVCLAQLCEDPDHQLRCKKCGDPICVKCREAHERECWVAT